MPEPYHPVDHLAVSRLVPSNSSSNVSFQSPRTPVGLTPTADGSGCSQTGQVGWPGVYDGNCRTDQDADDNDARNGIGRNP